LKAAWFLSQRIRENMRELFAKEVAGLGGDGKIVEADEKSIGGREKNKHRSKRYAANAVGGGMGKEAVFALVERGDSVRSQDVPAVSAATLGPVLRAQLDSGSFLMTDGEG
jgi:hypothetical protein